MHFGRNSNHAKNPTLSVSTIRRKGCMLWFNHVKNVKDTVTKPSTIPAFVQDEKKVQLEGRDAWDPWVDNWSP